MLLEPIVEARVGVVGGSSVQMRFNLNAVGMPIDERWHASGTETHAVVVKIFAVNALHALASVLVAIGSKAGLKRTVSVLLGIGLVGPREVVFGRHRW